MPLHRTYKSDQILRAAVLFFVLVLIPTSGIHYVRVAVYSWVYPSGWDPRTYEPQIQWDAWKDGPPPEGTFGLDPIGPVARHRVGTLSRPRVDYRITEIEEAATGGRGFVANPEVHLHRTRILLEAAIVAAGLSAFIFGTWLLGQATWQRYTGRQIRGFDVLPPESADRNHTPTAVTAVVDGRDSQRSE